jgi:hypothetical protein
MAKLEEIVDQRETTAPPKINNASLTDLKATSDDAIAPVLACLNHPLLMLMCST